MEYIEIEELLEELYNSDLRSYSQTSLIDDSIFYPVINQVLATLKIKTKVIKQDIISIHNFKGELPSDFFKVKEMFTCKKITHTFKNPTIKVETKKLDSLNKCDINYINTEGNNIIMVQKFEDTIFEFDSIIPLNLHKSSISYSCDNFISNSKNYVSIQNGFINTEFREGDLVMVYESTENDGKIPNYEKLKSAIKTLCTYEAFKIMFINGEQDIIQKLQYIEPKAAIAINIISNIAKEQSFSNFREWKKMQNSRYLIHNKLNIYGG